MSDADKTAPTHYAIRYLCDGYTVADAFRTVPAWGMKGYTVRAEALGQHTEAELVAVAQDTAPPNHWLHRIEAIGGEPHVREVFMRPVPWARTESAADAGRSTEGGE